MTDQSLAKLQTTRWGLVPLVLFCALVNASQSKAGPNLIFGSWDKSNCSNGFTRDCAVAPDFPSDTKTAHNYISCCVSDNGGTTSSTGVFHGFTLGPMRPGLMTVVVTTWIDNENYGHLHQWGSVVSLADPSSPATVYSWSGDCITTGCTPPIPAFTFPIELGTSFDVNLGDILTVGPATANHGATGAFSSMAQFSFQEVSEPSTLALLGVAFMSGAAAYGWRKVGMRRGMRAVPSDPSFKLPHS